MVYFFTGFDSHSYERIIQRADYWGNRGIGGGNAAGRYAADGYLVNDHAHFWMNSGFGLFRVGWEIPLTSEFVVGCDVRPTNGIGGPGNPVANDWIEAGYSSGGTFNRRIIAYPNPKSPPTRPYDQIQWFRGRTNSNFDYLSWPSEGSTLLGDTGSSLDGANFFQASTWHNWEIIFRNGGNTEVWREGVKKWEGALATLGQFNRAVFCHNRFGFDGFTWDNLYVGTDRLGPCRAAAAFPRADYLSGWTPNSGANRYSRVNDSNPAIHNTGKPDGDTTYIRAISSGEKVLFNFERLMPFGSIHAVQITAFIRAESANGSFRFAYEDPDGTPGTTASQATTAGWTLDGQTYKGFRQIFNTDPITSAAWTDERFLEYKWGLENMASVPIRCTQIFVERLSAVGGGAFSITRAY